MGPNETNGNAPAAAWVPWPIAQMKSTDYPPDSVYQRFVLLRSPTYAALLLSPIAFSIVLSALSECNWADVTIHYNTFDGVSHILEADIGLSEVMILLSSGGNEIARELMSYTEAAQGYGHLPVLRHHAEFDSAGLTARALLWCSEACFAGLWLSVMTRLLCKRPGMFSTMLLGVLQGVTALGAVLGWYLTIPSIGAGRTYRFYVGAGFKSVLGGAI